MEYFQTMEQYVLLDEVYFTVNLKSSHGQPLISKPSGNPLGSSYFSKYIPPIFTLQIQNWLLSYGRRLYVFVCECVFVEQFLALPESV